MPGVVRRQTTTERGRGNSLFQATMLQRTLERSMDALHNSNLDQVENRACGPGAMEDTGVSCHLGRTRWT
jgi:hypothetical protein